VVGLRRRWRRPLQAEVQLIPTVTPAIRSATNFRAS
jgi:hypothetical protein